MTTTFTWQGESLAKSPEANQTWKLGPVRLGYIEYLNCLPVYWGIEKGIIDLPVAIKKGPPAVLNKLFFEGALDISPSSSIEYARHPGDTLILPNLSIAADGRVTSVLLLSKKPLGELDGAKVALTSHSATSVVLTKIILGEKYGVKPDYFRMEPDPYQMLAEADCCLVIGDPALRAVNDPKLKETFPEMKVYDLGEQFKELTGEIFVFALWMISRQYVERNPEGVKLVAELFQASRDWAVEHWEELIQEGVRRRGLPEAAVRDHFTQIRHHFTPEYRRGLLKFYELAHKIGEIPAVPELHVWGE